MTNTNTEIKIAMVCSLPYGYGGMENMISILLNHAKSIGHIEPFFFDFHNGENKRFCLSQNICLPHKKLPRIVQEAYIILQLRSFISYFDPDCIICLDDKSCQLTYRSMALLRQKNLALGSWLHRSLHTYKKTNYIKKMGFHIAISKGLKLQLEEIGVPPEKIFYLPNCNTSNYTISSLPEKLSLNEIIHFVYIGRVQFEAQKNLQDLFLAFARVEAPCHLDIIGDGPRQEVLNCKKLCKELGISEKVTFHGWQPNAWQYLETKRILNIAALCLTSTYEGFPLVLIEAISQGIFCISSDCPTGPKDILNADNGILYSTGNITELTQAMYYSINTKKNRSTIRKTSTQYSQKKYISNFKQIIFKNHE